MASLIEELVSVMKREDEIYRELIPIEDEKTRVIIKNDLNALQEITEKEQYVIEQITVLERKREEVIVNIGVVLNRNPSTLNMKTLVKIMARQPQEQKKLAQVHDSLETTLKRLVAVNDRNKVLIQQSLEMIEFNMNLIQSSRTAPGLNNYTKGASQNDQALYQRGIFDARQ